VIAARRGVWKTAGLGGRTMLKLLFSSVVTGLALVCFGLGAGPSIAAQIAASIEYVDVERPGGLPDDFRAPAGTSLRFLSIKAIDGFPVQAALWHPSAKAPAKTTLLVMVHGSGGSYARDPTSTLGRNLSAHGFAALAINTRQHDDKRNTDNFFETSRDIDAAVQTAKALGYHSIVLQGHSLGTLQVLFYAATNWDRDIKALVQLSALGNLPWRSRYLQVQDEDQFRLLSEAALKALRDGKEQNMMPLRMRRTTTQEEALTGEHFLTYRAEATAGADGPFWIRRVPRPILMVRDAGDMIIPPFEPYTLMSSATSTGSLVPGIKFVELPDAKGPNPGGHFFAGNGKPLAETIARWLADQNL
jgi:pimeloyl-ACP methyl ester carboxylesterase